MQCQYILCKESSLKKWDVTELVFVDVIAPENFKARYAVLDLKILNNYRKVYPNKSEHAEEDWLS